MEEDGDEPSAPSCRLAVACFFFFFASLPSVRVFHGRHHPATSRTWPARMANPPHNPPPTPLSHIGTSPPQAYPEFTPPLPRRGPHNSGPKTTPIRRSSVFLSPNKGIGDWSNRSASNTLDVVVPA
jgi:hypothetical protein